VSAVPDATGHDRRLPVDLMAAVLRIEQATDPSCPAELRAVLLQRLRTCDAPRLRRHIPAWLQEVADEVAALDPYA
jgi:hypothetical protein